jgi:transcriptional repressor NrdR
MADASHANGALMRCPFCQNDDTQVIDSRASDEGVAIRRPPQMPFMRQAVHDLRAGGTRDADDHQEAAAGAPITTATSCVRRCGIALRKRPVSREAVDDAIGRIEDKLLTSAQREVKSEKLGELVMRELKAARQGRLYPLCVGLSQLRGRRRICRGGQGSASDASPAPSARLDAMYTESDREFMLRALATGAAIAAFTRRQIRASVA